MGAQEGLTRPLRVVFDTNVVVSALLFASGRLAWLRPACRDATDLPFLALAAGAGADALVTGDDDLLAVSGRFRISILTPEAFRQRIGTDVA